MAMTLAEAPAVEAPAAEVPAGDPPAAPDAPITIAVLGSCVTRDNFNTRFNPDYKRWYRTVLMQNQSSLISVMSPPTPITPEEIGQGTEYDQWNVRTDFSKEFLDELGTLRPDYLILDWFGDVHFGCLELAPGRYVTNNRWKLWPTPWYQALKAAGPLAELRIDRDTDRYLELWREAFDRLRSHIEAVAPDTTVIVHRGRNTGLLTRAGRAKPVSLVATRKRKVDVPLLNRLWAEMDEYAVSTTGWAAIDLTGREYPTFDGHPWGPYYVHYAMDYYSDFLAGLNRIHLERTLGKLEPYLAPMLATVVGSRAGNALPSAAGHDAGLGTAATPVAWSRGRDLRGRLGSSGAARPLRLARRLVRRLRSRR